MRPTQPDLFAPREPTAPIATPITLPGTGTMRGLTLWRPWPWSMHGWLEPFEGGHCVLHEGPKDMENRGWHPPEALVGKCWLALHSGKHFDKDAVGWLLQRAASLPPKMPDSVITGVALLEREFGHCDRGCNRCRTRMATTEPLASSPFYMGAVGWVLSGRVPLITPVPCKGSMGLFRLDPDVESQVRAEYARSVTELGDQLAPGPRMAA